MKKEQALTPAGRVSQHQTTGGVAMRDLRIVWSTIDAAHHYNSFLIIELMNEEDYEEFIKLPFGTNKSVYLAEKLEGRKVFIPDEYGGRELEFPSYFDEYGRKDLFWYNNVYETHEEAYERLVREWKEKLDDYYKEGEEEALEEEARERAEEELNSLPVVRI
jgi:hypothetical protein